MKRIVLSAITVFCFLCAFSQTGIPVPQMSQCDNLVQQFLTKYAIPGATFTMSKDGRIVYARAFGYQDKAKTLPTQPYTLFRIASCSKPITSIAVMLLMQQGKIRMNDTVFGPRGILNANPYYAGINITDTRINSITVRNLLEHSAGWNRDLNCFPNPTTPYPYYFAGCDPIAVPLRVAQETDGINPTNNNEMIKFLLQKGLDFAPGTQYHYSNIGYLVLGRVIEQITGMNYDAWVKQNVFDPLGICDIHLAKNLLVNKQEREGEYVGNGYTTLSCYNTGQSVPWEYGGFNIEAMDAHGGWIATASDLVRLITAVDGFATKPDILTPASIDTMTAPSANLANYAKGWQVNSFNNWWHIGALDGTATEIVRSSNGYTWAILLNKRDILTSSFWTDLDNLPWSCVSSTTSWPTWDLMESPTVNSSAIAFSNVAAGSMKISWTKGNGERRILVAHKSTSINGFPGDGTSYAANAGFGTGTDLGSGNYVVYNDTGSSVTVSNLEVGSTYYFRLFDYNSNAATGNNALYLRCNSTEASAVAGAVLPVSLGYFTAKAANASVVVQWQSLSETNTRRYDVERSADGVRFATVGSVPANGQGVYSFTDPSPVSGTSYYRLKMVDNNSSAATSRIVEVQFSSKGYRIYPTPAHNQLTIEIPGGVTRKTVAQVIDAKGKVVLQQVLQGAVSHLSISALAPGVYSVKMIAGAAVSVQKFTKL